MSARRRLVLATGLLGAAVLVAGCESSGGGGYYSSSSVSYYGSGWNDPYYRHGCCRDVDVVVRPPPGHRPGNRPPGHRPPGNRPAPGVPSRPRPRAGGRRR